MKFQLLTLVLSAMFLTVHSIPDNIRYFDDNILLRTRCSPNEDVAPNVNSSINITEEYPHVLSQHVPVDKTVEESITEIIDASPNNNKSKNQNSQPDSEEDNVSNNESIPKTNMRREPPVSNFFPIMFGGYDSGTRRSGLPTGATAIANSFSTGKDGVATSNATAYGSFLLLKHFHGDNNE